LVDNGQIVVVGGLIQDENQTSVDKVPLLGDIPVIGALFKYESRSRKRTNLMVFLRPVVVKDEKTAASITADRYEYIRNLQSDIKLPWNGLLPARESPKLVPLDQGSQTPLGTTKP
jgi:general secretion pathway protein D